jgi:hypothetical protein
MTEMGLLHTDAVAFPHGIRPHNALLFDFALKRLREFDGHRFPASVFETRKFFENHPTTELA